jgi:neutral trehalase
MVNVSRVYRQPGKLVEKYDVVRTDRPGGGGEDPTPDGDAQVMALYPADADLASVEQCPNHEGG